MSQNKHGEDVANLVGRTVRGPISAIIEVGNLVEVQYPEPDQRSIVQNEWIHIVLIGEFIIGE